MYIALFSSLCINVEINLYIKYNKKNLSLFNNLLINAVGCIRCAPSTKSLLRLLPAFYSLFRQINRNQSIYISSGQ